MSELSRSELAQRNHALALQRIAYEAAYPNPSELERMKKIAAIVHAWEKIGAEIR